ncbi:histidine kinase [Pseudoxanthomonas sp. SGT-18]|uniref:sensor histidine kinase n=1 Tax=Pseudoxanthomonas sp. SGT-18 TaxID=2493087 RepID=UPI000F62B278|nr:histidine kinase [Pseudoxanthomonas sp. SGT-18]
MRDPRRELPWFPDLCRLPRLAALLGLAELVVVVLALVPTPGQDEGWPLARFVYASGFALWLALGVAVLLCKLRVPISRLPQRLGAVAAVAMATLVALVCAGIVHGLYTALGIEPLGVGLWRFAGGSAAVTTLITALALRHFYVSDRWAAQTEANARAEADALQARIRPHFLFNSMNLIAGLLRRDPVLAERAVLDLSDLFRAALGAGEGESTLAAECELASQYLSIEQLRLGERLRVEWEKREPLPWDLPVPRLVLQPLVENAVLHGISRLPGGGKVSIRLWCQGQCLYLRVGNPAPGPEAQSLPLQRGAGHAQRSIAHRLAWRFGPEARVTAGWADGYYACEVTLPLPDA